jgi:putative lipoprotein
MQATARFALPLAFGAAFLQPREVFADEFFGPDKALHFGVSAGFSIGAYAASTLFLDEPWQRAVFSSAVTLSLGAAKEGWDALGHGTPSLADFAWDAAGTTVGVSVALTLDLTRPFAREPR